jgi:tetratricopeptide (TPR) repeat protein
MRMRWIPYAFCLAASIAPRSGAADPAPGGLPAVLQEARARQAVAAYDEAVDGLERFARESPAAKEAPDALLDAVVIRLALGQVEQARADVRLFVKARGTDDPKRSAEVSLALAAYLEEHQDWLGEKIALVGWVAAFDASAAIDQQILAHTMLGRVLVRLNDGRKAEAEYGRVLDLWKDPPSVVSRIEGEGGGDRRLAKALIAEGEALFFFAEKKRRSDVETVRFPEFRGPSTREDVLAHLNGKVKGWIQRKRPAIEETEREYRKIVDLQPAPPPRWVIAAANRVGSMWGRFVAEFRAAPIPRGYKGHGPVPGAGPLTYDDLRREWYEKLDEASAPQKAMAKAAFSTCVAYSVKFQYDDAYAHACREWLAKHYPDEYHPLDELAPKPHLLGDAPVLLSPLAAP